MYQHKKQFQWILFQWCGTGNVEKESSCETYGCKLFDNAVLKRQFEAPHGKIY